MNWRLVARREVGSTNDIAKRFPPGTVVVAERQTAGRGKAGRLWHSPPGGLWLSAVVPPPVPSQAEIALSLASALAQDTGLPIRYRPPNDLQLAGKKLGGVLVEVIYQGGRERKGVVGIGINVNNRAGDLPLPVRELAISLREATGKAWELERVLKVVLSAIEVQLKEELCQPSR